MTSKRIVLSETEELFLAYLEDTSTIKAAAERAGVSESTGYIYARKLKDEIITRAREKLAVGTLRATTVILDSMEADASVEKGELRLKAAESLLDRSGLTKHTSVEVAVESENGIFILPAKTLLGTKPDEDEDEADTILDTPEDPIDSPTS